MAFKLCCPCFFSNGSDDDREIPLTVFRTQYKLEDFEYSKFQGIGCGFYKENNAENSSEEVGCDYIKKRYCVQIVRCEHRERQNRKFETNFIIFRDDNVDDYTLNEPGYKLHITIDDEDFERGWNIIIKHIIEFGLVHFKVIHPDARKTYKNEDINNMIKRITVELENNKKMIHSTKRKSDRKDSSQKQSTKK